MRMRARVFLVVSAILIFFVAFAAADSISSYVVPAQVPLNTSVSATGIYSQGGNVQCSFYLRDANSRVLLYRATDQFTVSDGTFAMKPKEINEPLFKRGNTYTVESICGSAIADGNFTVMQMESIAAGAAQNFEFITSPENTDTVFIWGVLVAIIVLILCVVAAVIFWKVR